MKNVLHIQLLPLLTGVQRVSLNEIVEVYENNPEKYNFSVACNGKGPLTLKLEEFGIDYFIIPELKRNVEPVSDFRAVFKLYKIIKHNKFDIVHTHSSKTGFLGRIAARLSGTPLVIHTVHGFSFPMTTNRFAKFVFFVMEWFAKFFTDKLIVLNESDYDIAVGLLGYRKDIVKIIPNGVNTDVFSPRETSNKRFHIVMVGRLWKQKNPLCLVKAVKILRDRNVDVKLDLIGDGELSSEIKNFVESNNMHNNVEILGWIDSVEKLLPAYDLFVLPSLWEGMPLAILEAQSCGLPAIVSDIPGNSDLVKDGFNGYLFEKDNSQDLADKIQMIVSDSNLREILANNAREYICNEYSNTKRNNSVLNIYNQC
ncbi:glycosyltransferase family 4 protein [Vibrio sp. B1Z05]|uniref:glycosyltransferase family 4 protein n=1 Tax=Vibrio sp. B1Z05 TaxID=2654980 RepID=UPI0020A61F3E|nr:glycosyltransferase family 4 protein [Vibrio sp. B1Z05]